MPVLINHVALFLCFLPFSLAVIHPWQAGETSSRVHKSSTGTLLDLSLTECKRVSPQYTWWPGYSPLCQAPGTTPTPPAVHMQKTRPRGFCTCKSWRWNSCPPKRKRFGPQFSTGVEVAFNRSNQKKNGVSSCLPCFPIKRKQKTTVTSSPQVFLNVHQYFSNCFLLRNSQLVHLRF